MSVKADLIAARALISKPENWGTGMGSWLRSQQPFRFPLCAYGACRAASPNHYVEAGAALQSALPGRYSQSDVAYYNDAETTTHDDIMALFDKAIEAAE